ncbi:MAG: polysaccharide biosynthesis protein, partial [Gammaproteobacteria bacterium]|nr:polysaccharide biosynthesis protein [Gammaproteobacteria bacterium]
MSKIYNRRCLITGCAGSIGSELCRQLSKDNKVFGIDQNESEFFNIQQETGIF